MPKKSSPSIIIGTTLRPAEIARRDEILDYVEVEHHAKEYEQGEGYEILHGVAVGAFTTFGRVFAAGEYKRFVGEAEGLQEHQQQYAYLVVGAVYALGRTWLRRGR